MSDDRLFDLAPPDRPTFHDDPGGAAAVPEHRVRVAASFLAGFRWPGHGTFEALKKPQQDAAVEAARLALERLEREP